MKNRHGVEYEFVYFDKNIYRFEMPEDDMKYMRMGGREGQVEPDMNDIGMFDPPGGPYVAIGSKIYWDEIQGGIIGQPLIVKRIMFREDGIFIEVE